MKCFRNFNAVLSAVSLLAMASVASAASPVVDGVMTITLSADTAMSSLTDEKALLDAVPCTVTKVVLLGGKVLTLDVALNTYGGGWEILDGKAKVTVAQNGLGVYSADGEVRVGSTTGKYPQLWLNGDVEVDKVVRFTESRKLNGFDNALFRTAGSNNVFKRKVYAAGDWWFFGGGNFTTKGGFEQLTGTISNQGNSKTYWRVEDVPVTISEFDVNICNIYLNVASNAIGKLVMKSRATFQIECAEALSGYPMTFVNTNQDWQSTYLLGNDTAWGDTDMTTGYIVSGSGAPTLSIGGDVDRTFRLTALEAPLKLTKTGTGKLTLGKVNNLYESGGYQALTVKGGTLAISGAIAALNICQTVTLDGGCIDVPSGVIIPTTTAWVVTDESVSGAIRLADGEHIVASSLTVNGSALAPGAYGGKSADVPSDHQLDCFDETSTGVMFVGPYVIDVASGATQNFSDLVDAATIAQLKANAHPWIRKTGAGTLVLDVDLTGYQGGWDIVLGTLNVQKAAGIGTYGGESRDIRILSTSSYLYVCGGEIDKPVHFIASSLSNYGHAMLQMQDTTTYFKRKMTIDANLGIFFGGSGTMYNDGGLEQKSGAIGIAAAKGSWYIRNKPAKICTLTNNYQKLYFQTPSNDVGRIVLSGRDIYVSADDAFSGGDGKTVVETTAGRSINMTGSCTHLEVGTLQTDSSASVTVEAASGTLVFTGDDDMSLGLNLSAKLNLVQKGSGRTTLARSRSGSATTLTVSNGTFAVSNSVVWSGCTGVTLAGGTLEVDDGDALGGSVGFTIADPTRAGQLKLADDIVLKVVDLWEGSVQASTDTYGGPASEADNKRDWFDAASTGLMKLVRPYTVTVEKGSTYELTAEDYANLNGNTYGRFVKKGAGTLKLTDPIIGFRGDWSIENGCIHVTTHDRAFGEDCDEPISIDNGTGGYFNLDNGTINRPVVSAGLGSLYVNPLLYVEKGTSNACQRAITGDAGVQVFLSANSADFLTTDGPIVAGGNITTASGGGHWVANGPITAGTVEPVWFAIHLNAPSNHISTLHIGSGSEISIGCDDALQPGCDLKTSANYISTTGQYSDQYLRLNGHDLAVSTLTFDRNFKLSTPEQTPVTFAFDVTNSVSLPNANWQISGPISFVKGGAGTLSIDGTLPGTGTELSATAGTLVLGAAAVLPRHLTLALTSDVACELADGRCFSVHDFLLDGVAQKSNTYGGTLSPAKNKWAVPFGETRTGYLYVQSRGFLLYFR